jgi:heme oxygenase
MKPLWEATRDLHHACEEHPVGAAMASGEPPMEWYADWLTGLWQIHSVIDKHMHPGLGRTSRLAHDIAKTGIEPVMLRSAADYAGMLTTEPKIAGAAYVLTGAHLMGGEVMRRRLKGFPTTHLEWDDRAAALSLLKIYRNRDDISEDARDCFGALLSVMDEIQGRGNDGSDIL